MNLIVNTLTDALRFHGRVLPDPQGRCVWINWSCAGCTVRFRGSRLRARFLAVQEEMMAPFETQALMLDPVVAALADGSEEFCLRQKVTEPEAWITLFEGEDGEHSLRITKLSENVMGKLGIAELETDGEFLPPAEEKKLRIEVVGDSITCGYGNETSQPGFRTEDENGEIAYGALAAKALGAEYSAVSVSGCSAAEPVWLPHMQNRGMLSMYAYTDAPMERLLGGQPATRWDFASNHSDVVVVNLGTNDANTLKMMNFSKEGVESFYRDFDALITDIRALNGPETYILVTLGSMDYYLWDDIRDIVAAYAERTGDGRIGCRKMGAIIPFTEGMGADTHPSAATHARMAKELEGFIREVLE